ncbi:MAG: folate family ECF transporter S component [Firmicutes bacterium]|nr:folate family ECF transporter S component [Bacillota bacterium]
MLKFKLRNLIFTGLLVSIGILLSQLFSFYYPPSTTIVKFGIGYVPLIIISLLFGPQYGLFAGITQDIIGYFLLGSERGIFYFGFTLNAILYGVLPGIFIYLKRKIKPNKFVYFNTALSLVLSFASIWYLFHINSLSSNANFTFIYRYILVSISLVSSLGLLFINYYFYYKKNESNEFQFIFFVVTILYFIVSIVLTPLWIYDMYSIPFFVQIPLRILKMPVEVILYTLILQRLLKVIGLQLNHDT